MLAGMLCSIPAAGIAGDLIFGKIISIDGPGKLLTLTQVGADKIVITVQYNDDTFICGRVKGGMTGCCMQPGKTVEIEGAFSGKDATLFTAASIKGFRERKQHDPTGVRARLHTCANRP